MAGEVVVTPTERERRAAERASRFCLWLGRGGVLRRAGLLILGYGALVVATRLPWPESVRGGVQGIAVALMMIPPLLLLRDFDGPPLATSRLIPYLRAAVLVRRSLVECRYRWDSTGLEFACGEDRDVHPWISLDGWSETPLMFLVFLPRRRILYLPRRAFQSVEIRDFRATLQSAGVRRL